MSKRVKSIIRKLLPKTVRKWRILSGPLRAQWIITSWHDYPAAILGYTERPLLDWFAQNVKAGETWLDVGAHYGYTAIALSVLVGREGRVFAFEPMMSTVGYLNQTRLANLFYQMMVMPFALGEGNQLAVARLPTTRGMVDSTLDHAEWEENIIVASLDWLWLQICGEHEYIDGIKIDVQGMELKSLQGMLRILKEYQPKLVIEFHSGVNRDDVLSLLEKAGYSRCAIPIESVAGEDKPKYLDDRSYAFSRAGEDQEEE